nr:hypothetical protein [uncultured bacterium]
MTGTLAVNIDLPTGGLILVVVGAVVELFRRKFQKYDELLKMQPLVELMYEAFKNEALDAMRMLAKPNPHPKRMHTLLDKYVACYEGRDDISADEIEELVGLLTATLEDKETPPAKLAWTSKSLRFIEATGKLPQSATAPRGH